MISSYFIFQCFNVLREFWCFSRLQFLNLHYIIGVAVFFKSPLMIRHETGRHLMLDGGISGASLRFPFQPQSLFFPPELSSHLELQFGELPLNRVSWCIARGNEFLLPKNTSVLSVSVSKSFSKSKTELFRLWLVLILPRSRHNTNVLKSSFKDEFSLIGRCKLTIPNLQLHSPSPLCPFLSLIDKSCLLSGFPYCLTAATSVI